jgi:hypothetical protein
LDGDEEAVTGRIFGQTEEASGKPETGYEAGALSLFLFVYGNIII